MDKTCKYYQYQKYVSYDNGQTWQPMNQFQRGELMEFNSPDCGAGVDSLYKWVLMDVNTDYYCDECPEDSCTEPQSEYIEAWSLFSSSDCGDDYYICSGTTKYYKEVKQISYDSGLTWVTPTPIEVRPSNIAIEYYSTDCGFEPSYRWYTAPITEEYICSGGSMYYKEYYQISNDGQQTWNNVIPTSSRTGNMYSECATQCGCGAPMFEANYSDSSSYKVVCGVSGYVITESITKTYKPISAMTDCLIGDCATAIGYHALSSSNKLSACTIGSGVTSIGDGAFYNSGIKNITIPNSVKSIGNEAFHYCTSLSSVTIPNSVTSIGNSVFEDCSSLTSCTIGSGVTSFGDYIFRHCNNLNTAIINSNISDKLFSGCTSLSSVTIGNSVTSIGQNSFNKCKSLTSIDIRDSVISIGDGAFENCTSLSSITIPNSVTRIGDSFYNCTSLPIENSIRYADTYAIRITDDLTTYTLKNNTRFIGYEAFYYCTSLTSINIPDSVIDIGNEAFYYCTNLTSITIPSGVIRIGVYAFNNCTNLTSITVNAVTPPELGSDAFYGSTCPIYVPAESVDAYKAASRWSDYASRIQAIPNS